MLMKGYMCGIFVVAGQEPANAQQRVLEGLQRLEYRGYDSWGIAIAVNGSLQLEKHAGKIGQVDSLELPAAQVAIGHTRWATHGGVTDANAHPHLSTDGSLALVQNGVVENYQELKSELEGLGYQFTTQTDTEVILHLLEEVWKKARQTQAKRELSLSEIAAVVNRLAGRSTVAVLTSSGRVLAFRLGSPLVVGRNQKGEIFLSSDVMSIQSEATQYYTVNNGELIEIDDGQVVIARLTSPESTSPVVFQAIDVTAAKLDKEGFDHFMVKEIFDQAQIWHQIGGEDKSQWQAVKEAVLAARRVYTLGAGSASYAAGQVAEYLRGVGVDAVELKAYQAISYLQVIQPTDVCIAFSQSGETADTLEIVETFKNRGLKIISLVNMSGSTLTAISDIGCLLRVGPEVAVASTKALTGQMLWGKVLSGLIGGKSLSKLKTDLYQLQTKLANWLDDDVTQEQIKTVADKLQTAEHIFVLGRGQLYYPAIEFALKLKEISYLHAEGFNGGELKHGTIALIEAGTPIVCLVADDNQKNDMLGAAMEVKARGGWVIGVSDENNQVFEDWLPLPSTTNFTDILAIVPSQLLAYHLALLKGLDPDKPRNLAKSVTVK